MKYCVHCGELLPAGESDVCLACGTVQKTNDSNADDFYNISEIPFDNNLNMINDEKDYPSSFAAFDDDGPTFGELPAEEIRQNFSVNKGKYEARPIKEIDEYATKMMPAIKKSNVSEAKQMSKPQKKTTKLEKEFDRKQKKRLKSVLILLVLSLVLLISTLGTALYLNSAYNINDDFEDLKTAMLSGDATALQGMLYSDGLEITSEGVNALLRAFSSEEKVNALLSQLANEISGTGENAVYPALYANLEDVAFGYQEFKLGVKPVSIQVSTSAQNATVKMDGKDVTPSSQDPFTISGLMPGVYTLVVRGETQIGQMVEGQSIDVEALNSDTPSVIDGALPISDVTVSGTINDTAVISVNGTQVEQTPVNGVVTLPQLLVGSSISMTATGSSGAVITSSVQFNDRSSTSLAFTEYELQGGMPSHAQIEQIVSSFYASYLNANNTKDINALTNVTAERRALMTEEITADKNEVYTFESASVSTANIAQSLEGGNPTVTFNATTAYKGVVTTETPEGAKETATTQHNVYYTVELVYSTEGWLVNRLAIASQQHYDSGELVPFA